MKKKYILLLIVGIIFIMLGGFIKVGLMDTSNEEYNKADSVKKTKSSKSLSMMLETGSGTGVYEQTTRESWPTDGYKFNEELSKCENGGKLSWNDENNTVVMTGSTSDKCYVYFDVYIPTLAEYVKSKYTGSQGSNGIYIHNSSLVNGANDGSYRYAGGDYALTSKATNAGLTKVTTTSSTETNGVINFYCSGTKQYVGYVCWGSTYYYMLEYDTSNTQYQTYSSALAKAVTDGYLTKYNVNNYVCFGSTATPCPDDNLYRIIGIFGDQVKLIKSDYANSNLLGTNGAYSKSTDLSSHYSAYKGNLTTMDLYYWNNSSNGSNVWSESNLNATNLNGTYLTNLGTIWANKITESIWKVGGAAYSNIVTSAMYNTYQNEIVSPTATTTYSAKIGLMYVSDYGYAASPRNWSLQLGTDESDKPDSRIRNVNSDYRTVINDNWLFMGLRDWTITPESANTAFTPAAFFVNYYGNIEIYGVNYANYSVRPTFYLSSDVLYDKGIGTSTDPIRLKI